MNQRLNKTSDKNWINQCNIFRFLNLAEKDFLIKNSNRVSFEKREVLFKQNMRTSHVMFLQSGLVKVYKEGKNKKKVALKIVTEGNFIGLMSVFGDDIYQYSASAIETSEIIMTDRLAFEDIIKRNGKFALELVHTLGRDGLFIFNKLLVRSHKQLPGRLADILLYFSQDIYKKQTFEFPLTRTELAELTGTTKESFIRTINEFKNDKIINLNGRKVEIVSMDLIRILSELG
jgi:CRP-like cAMP-binding protein